MGSRHVARLLVLISCIAILVPTGIPAQERPQEPECDAFCPGPEPPPPCTPATMYDCRHCYLFEGSFRPILSNQREGLRVDRVCTSLYTYVHYWSWAECGLCGI